MREGDREKNERRQIKSRNREDRSIVHQRTANADIDWLRKTEYYWQQKKFRILFSWIFYSYYSYFCRSVIIILISATLYSVLLFLPLCIYYSYFSHATLITFEGVEDPECGELEGGAMLSDQWTTIKCRLDTFQEGKGELVLVREISREIKTPKMRKDTTT